MGLNPNQQKIVDTLHASVNVAAGAGTGKTFTLTKRTTACVQDILAQDQSDQVCSVNPIERILEITFTEKAAAELKSRVRSELFEVAKQSEDARILEAALDADNAWISTIHAMCSRILKENALAFGLDPAFEVLDNAESNSIFVTAAEDILDDFRAASYPYADELLDAYPLSLGAQVVGGKSGSFSKKDLISIVRDLFGKVDYMPKGLDGVVSLEARLDPHELFRMMLEAVSEFPQDFDAEGLGNASEAKKAPGYAEEAELAKLAVMDWFEDNKDIHSFTDEGFDAQDFMDALLTFPATTNTFGKKSAYAGEFSAYRQTYKWVCAASLAEIGLRSFSGVRSFASLLYERILQLKNEGGTRLDNNDLLKRVAYEFADPKNEAILNKYRRQFEFIMLDEFQDTDKLQMQIVKSLAHDKNELQGEIAFANLCTVGDMQQSIYRFRGGDVEESLARAASLAGVAESTFKLDANYRSHPAVLDAVEMIFSRPNAFGDDFLRLEAGRSDFNPALDDIFTGHDARILFDFVHKKTGRAGSPGVSSEDAKRASAMRIARRFKHIKDAAAASGDAKAQASANSMAILLRTLKNADVYADALRDVGIDSVISGGSVFAEMPEAHLVDFLLKVAVNPADEEPLFNVLTSPLFAVSDTALLMLVYRCKDSSQNAQGATAGVGRHVVGFKRSASLSRAFFDDALMSTALDAVQEEDACSLQIAQACLKDFIECARVKSVSVALRKLFNNSGLLARLQGDDASAAPSAQNISSAANISKAITIVEDLEQNCFGVAQVSDAYSTYLQNEKESPGSLALSGSNFVQIMTIHA
jgi:ATP-dependent exoDNAse (exonuclease V) beta subunit